MNMKQQFRLAAALFAITAIGASQASAQTGTNAQSEPHASAKTPGTVEIDAGTVGTVGGWRTGVGGVDSAGAVTKVHLSVAAYSAGVAAEYSMQAVEHALAPFGDGLHKILWISPGTQTQRGRVGIAAAPLRLQPNAPGRAAVYIVAGGWLRVNGPETSEASDIHVTTWNTDQLPASVEVKWMSSQYAEKDTNPKNIERAHLTAGSSLNIRGHVLTVRAIEPQTAEHPAWVRFEMAANSKPR